MLRHIVLFALDGFDTAADKNRHLLRLKMSLEALTNEIEVLNDLKVRLNTNPDEAYDFALEADLNCIDCLKAYAEHPLHQRIVQEMIKPYQTARAAVDYVY